LDSEFSKHYDNVECEGYRMVKSETRQDVETLVKKSEPETSLFCLKFENLRFRQQTCKCLDVLASLGFDHSIALHVHDQIKCC